MTQIAGRETNTKEERIGEPSIAVAEARFGNLRMQFSSPVQLHSKVPIGQPLLRYDGGSKTKTFVVVPDGNPTSFSISQTKTRPELNDGQILQKWKMLFESLDHLADDGTAIVGTRQESGQGASASNQEAIVPGQSEIGIDELGIPALHLFPIGEQMAKFLVRQGFGEIVPLKVV